jgi:hypothetical protein
MAHGGWRCLGLGTGLLCMVACDPPIASPEASRVVSRPPSVASVTVVARSPVVPSYPCSQCHGERRPPNPKKRELTEIHTVIELDHGSTPRWCHECHDRSDYDRLVLPHGERIDFDDSHRMCGGCHGEKLADWRDDLHGLTTGRWMGPKQRRSCTSCHDPHRPRTGPEGWAFPMMTPLPPPTRPGSPGQPGGGA